MITNRDLTVSLRPKMSEPAPQSIPPMPPAPRRPRRRARLSDYVTVLTIAVLLVGCVYAWLSWDTWFPDAGGITAQEDREDIQETIDDVVAEVEKLIVLPEGEEPTIATVTDPEKLRDQVFFANAKEGHKVLIYTKAQKAYLYDPVAKRLIEVAPLTVQSP